MEKNSKLKLLTFCRRTTDAINKYFPKPKLLAHPFHRAISRINYKPDLFYFQRECETVREIQNRPDHSFTWADLCDRRALKLLEMNRTKYYISYSGGIDSTCVMAAILKNWPKEELKRITILLNHNSVIENPEFFRQNLLGFKMLNSLGAFGKELLANDTLMVTGELGDQLFGSDILSVGCEHFGDQSLHAKFMDLAPKIIGRLIGDDEQAKPVFEHFLPIIEESPFPLKTCHDFFWWYNYTQKWQYVKLRPYNTASWPLEARYEKQIIHFFDCPDFQKWSLLHHDKKIKNTWDSYKWPAKDYIYELNKDPSQKKLKKVQSLKNLFMLSRIRIGILSNYTEIQNLEEVEPYVRKKL